MLKSKLLLLTVIVFILLSSTISFGATITYQYDDLHRLTRVERSDGTVTVYTYDELGNRTSMIVTNPNAITYYCDKDNDTHTNSLADGTCIGIGCQPSNCQTTTGDDCNDNDASIYSGAPELCDNKDNNCDGQVDENLTRPTICGVGACSGNTGIETCTNGTWGNNTCNPLAGATPDVCDGVDNDCDGQVDEGFVSVETYCGIGVCASIGQNICVNGVIQDTCIPGQPTGNDDTCNGIDENCSGTPDEGYVPTNKTCGIGECASTGQLICQNGAIVDTCIPGQPQTEGPYGSPTCSDGKDNDCDGLTDAIDTDCMEPSGLISLPQTGQTKCYDSAGAEIPCADTGQDGEIQAGVTWPDPRFSSGTGTEADCITDNLTGLIWQKNGNLGGAMTWNNAIDYANNFNLCGYSDWRLPNVNELESLVNAGVSNTSAWLNTQGFINVQADYYWSSTTYANDTSSAWVVGMLNEYVGYPYKSNNYYVLPVRSGQSGKIQLPQTGQKTSYRAGDDGDIQSGVVWPSQRFTIGPGAETECITDNLTGLMWPKDANLSNGTRTWQGALDYVASINNSSVGLCGYTDWRLPNRKEIRSMIDYSSYNPLLPAGHPFINVQLYYYWSSTTTAWITSDAWIVDMGGGYVVSHGKGSNFNNIWPVRGGLCLDTDGDGYGNPGNAFCQNGSENDCDDNNTNIHPGATEICDGKDNDCDGQIDEGLLNTYYRDADGDTYGNPNNTTQACTLPAGYVTNNTDCNDSDSSINPVSTEICDGKDNNCNNLIDEGGLCDLIVSSWTAPANACAGATISIKDTTKNQGTGLTGASTTKFYFSTNTILDAGDTPLGSRAVPSLNPAAISTGTTSVTLPNVAIGKYYLISMADDGKVVTESNETNNKKTKVIYIGPDLIVSALTAPTSATLGTTISITETTKNKGCGTGGASTTKFYLSTNTTINIGIDYELGTRPVPSLGTNAISTGATSVVIPAGIPTGKYYIITNADDAKVVVESNEMNNKRTKAITVTP